MKETRPPGRPEASIEFGTAPARALLVQGWSNDERWNGKIPFVWAEGSTATLRLPPLPPGNHELRVRANPFVRGQGLSCQIVAVDVNGTRIGRILLDRGWNDYELEIPTRVIRSSENEIALRFDHATAASRRDSRRLAVAFHSLELFAGETPRRVQSGLP